MITTVLLCAGKMHNGKIMTLAILLWLWSATVSAQKVSFELKEGQNIEFVFNTIQKYRAGILKPGVANLRIIAEDANWNLYVGAETQVVDYWNPVSTYATYGEEPRVGILELSFRNQANTAQVLGFFPLTDISNPVYIIGSENPGDPAVDCPGQGTNTPGNHLASPHCYRFMVDMKITPGFQLQPGLYYLIISYTLVVDL